MLHKRFSRLWKTKQQIISRISPHRSWRAFPLRCYFTYRERTTAQLFLSQYQTFCLFIFSVLCFIHPRPSKVRDLPDSVCQVFLDKMGTANLTSLPPHAPSRLALAERALLCLSNVCSAKINKYLNSSI